MSRRELEALTEAAASGGPKDARELLRFLRKERLREPALVMQHGQPLLSKQGALGDDLWVVTEQVFVAALDTGDHEAAQGCLTSLLRKFPGSARVRLLTGMLREARGDSAGAATVYTDILSANAANALAAKRRVTALLAQGEPAAAVAALNEALSQSPSDAEAWTALAALHMGSGSLEEAAFCYEELVLIAPSDPHHHCRLAELYYSLGGADATLRARKHFAQSLELARRGGSGAGVRALVGLCAACAALAGDRSPAAQRILRAEHNGEVNAALHAWAREELAAVYAAAGGGDAALGDAAGAVAREQAVAVAAAVIPSGGS